MSINIQTNKSCEVVPNSIISRPNSVSSEALSTRTRRTNAVVYVDPNGDYVAVGNEADGELARDASDASPVIESALEDSTLMDSQTGVGVQFAPGFYDCQSQIEVSRTFSLYGAGRNRCIVRAINGPDTVGSNLITEASGANLEPSRRSGI